MMVKETETTNPQSLGRLQGRVHLKRDLFFIGFQVVLPFIFLFKCSQDIIQVANSTTGTLTPQGAKGHNITGLKHKEKLFSQEQQMSKNKNINCGRSTNQPQTTNGKNQHISSMT